MERIENRTFDELKIGDSASLVRTLTYKDIQLFAAMSGDVNPAHVDPAFAKDDMFHKVIAHGMWGGALISTVLGTELPGPGAIYLGQSLQFRRPVGLGDTITVAVRVAEKNTQKHRVTLDCEAKNQKGETVITRTAVVHPVDSVSLIAAIEAAREGLIVPVLVGPEHKIRAAAEMAKLDLASYEVVPTEHSAAAANRAVALARAGQVSALMKGALHTDELMHAVVDAANGLRTARRISHVFAMDAPAYPRPLFITDAAINMYPTLEDKRDIVQNAIDLVRALRQMLNRDTIELPRVAILSAVETVTEKIKSTLDAAALCKMADRGQITGAILDGPLAFDNAVSEEAAKTKGIVSPVAGKADIFVVPDLEAGNMLAKQLEYLGDAGAAGIVLGARVPIILTSRADNTLTRLGSCAMAQLLVHHQQSTKVSAL